MPGENQRRSIDGEPAHYRILIDEMRESRKECADGHKESMVELSKLTANQLVISARLDIITKTTQDNSDLIHAHGRLIHGHGIGIKDLNADKTDLYKHITKLKDSNILSSTTASFWVSENGKWAIIGFIVVVAGLAGINIQGLLP
jgi:hypothetical protein